MWSGDDNHFLVSPVWLCTEIFWHGVLLCVLYDGHGVKYRSGWSGYVVV